MARKKIREFDAKRIVKKNLKRVAPELIVDERAVQVSPGVDMAHLRLDQPWLETTKLVVKPDMLFGQRGKNDLLRLNATADEAQAFVEKRMGADLAINGVEGKVTHMLVEPFLPHDKEYYLSYTANAEETTVCFSAEGGVEIEDGWEAKVKSMSVAVGDKFDCTAEWGALLPEGIERERGVAFINGCFKVFEEACFTMLEMNPWCFTPDTHQPIPLDMRGELDDTAAFKCAGRMEGAAWGDEAPDFPAPFGRVENPEEDYIESLDAKTGASLKLTVLNPEGRVWCLVAGGGASVIFADTVADLGHGTDLGNYGEYSGAPNAEETYNYARTVIELACRTAKPDERRALVIGGGIANFTSVAKTFGGIIHALRLHADALKKANFMIFVRRGGPGEKEGLANMAASCKELGLDALVCGAEVHMTSIVPKALAWVEKGEKPSSA